MLVLLVAVSGWFALYFTHMSTLEPLYDDTRKYVFQNLGTTFFITYIILGMFLAWKHSLYWPFLKKVERKLMDERQIDIRERIFEKSYRVFASVVLASVVIFSNSDGRMEKALWWFGVSTFFLLPVLIASWRKDS